MIKAKYTLFAYLLWVLIAFPYVSFLWSTPFDYHRGGSWHFDHLGVNALAVFLPAAVGVGTFTVLRRLRAFAGAIVGGLVPLLLSRALHVDILQVGAYGIVLWNGIAGFITGGLLGRISFEAGPAISESNFGWISAALWVVVLRVSELAIAADLRDADQNFVQEFLTFVPILLWSPYASKRLFRKAAATTHMLVFWSIMYAVAVEIASAVSIFPIPMFARGNGGTGEAFVLLARVPGPGIVWGAVMGYVLSKYRMRPSQPEIAPTLVSEA